NAMVVAAAPRMDSPATACSTGTVPTAVAVRPRISGPVPGNAGATVRRASSNSPDAGTAATAPASTAVASTAANAEVVSTAASAEVASAAASAEVASSATAVS